MSSGLTLAYAVFPDAESARAIARTVVSEGLAACANILAPCTSLYRWEGALEENVEVPALFKTADARASALVERIVALHPYAVPAITCWPVDQAPEAFVQWVMAAD